LKVDIDKFGGRKMKFVKEMDCMTGREIYYNKENGWCVHKLNNHEYKVFQNGDMFGQFTSLCIAMEEIEKIQKVVER
jgi:hypothetical protein